MSGIKVGCPPCGMHVEVPDDKTGEQYKADFEARHDGHEFCAATDADENEIPLACVMISEHLGDHVWSNLQILPEGHPSREAEHG